MISVVLIAAGVLIGLKVETWRGVFGGAASIAGVCVVLFGATTLLRNTDGPLAILGWALFTGLLIFVFSLGVIALTFAIRRANRRPKAAELSGGSAPDQFRES